MCWGNSSSSWCGVLEPEQGEKHTWIGDGGSRSQGEMSQPKKGEKVIWTEENILYDFTYMWSLKQTNKLTKTEN